MRTLSLALLFSVLTLIPSSGNAGDARPRQIAAVSDTEKVQGTNPNSETYRGYFFDLTEIAERQDFALIVDALRHQIDIVEGVGLSRRVFQFFHTVPILVDEFACLSAKDGKSDRKIDAKMPVLDAACYHPVALDPLQSKSLGVSVWDKEEFKWIRPRPPSNKLGDVSAVDKHLSVDPNEYTNVGVVMVRPRVLNPQAPILLHELLHAYHAHIMPQGFEDRGIQFYYNVATSNQLYPANAYLMTNEKEFFAVTASVFLSGKDNEEPFTRAKLKEKQPEYFKYLVWLFGFDPDYARSVTPLASAD